MPSMDEIYDVKVYLRTGYNTIPAFDSELLLIDAASVPVYDDFRIVTPDDISDLTAGSVERNFATAYFGQDDTPSTLVLGRWTSTTVPPAFVCPVAGVVTTPATWAALGTGATFSVTDGTNTTAVTLGSLAGVTAFSQVITVLNAGLAALTTPDVVGLDDATFALDYNSNLVLTMPATQDDEDPTITIVPSATAGTVAYLLGIQATGDGEAVEGRAVETLLDAHDRLRELVGYYNIAIADRAADADEIIELAAQIETERRQLTVIDNSAAAYTAGVTTDLQSRASALSYDRTLVIYTEQSDYPDAAADGVFLPSEPGTRSYGHTPLSGVLPSGTLSTNYALSSTKKTVLDAKGTNYLRMDGTGTGAKTYVHRGKTAGGKEKRQVLGVDWIELTIQAELFAADMNTDLLAFDAFTLGVIDGILRNTLDEAVRRRIIVDYTVTLPKPEDFTAAEKASGDMELLNAFTATGVFEAHTFTIRGAITL